MELQELVERINRWKLRLAGELPEEDAPQFTSHAATEEEPMAAAEEETMAGVENTPEESFSAEESLSSFGDEYPNASGDQSDMSMMDQGFGDEIDEELAQSGGTEPAMGFETDEDEDYFNEQETVAIQAPIAPVVMAPPSPPAAAAPAALSGVPEVPSIPGVGPDGGIAPTITTQEVDALDFVDEEK